MSKHKRKRKKASLTGRREANKKKQWMSIPENRERDQAANRANQKKRLVVQENRKKHQVSDRESHRKRRSSLSYRAKERKRDTVAKRAKMRLTWVEAENQFEKNIKDGPNNRCFCCDRLFFLNQIKKRKRQDMHKAGWSDELIAELVVTDHVNDNVFDFCSSCNKHFAISHKRPQLEQDLPKKFPKFCAKKSNLIFPDLPEYLLTMTDLEQRTVALRTPFMKIQALGCDRQYGIKSGIINVPTNWEQTMQAFPRNPKECAVIEVRFMRQMLYKNCYMNERIRPYVVRRSAEYLNNQELYKHLKLDKDWEQDQIQALAEMDLEQKDNQEELTDDQLKEKYGLTDADIELLKQILAKQMELPPNPEAVEQNEGYIEEETMLESASEGIAIAPSEGQRPIPMFLDKYYKEMAWPSIWGGNPCPETPAGIKISESDKSHHEVLRYDRRACNPAYLLFLHKVEMLRQLQNAQHTVMRRSAQTNSITAADVLDKKFIDNAIRKDNAYRFMSCIVGSPAYWEEKKKNVLAMVRQFGIFTLFITLTAAETKWPELLVILKKTLDKKDINEEEATQLPFEEVSRLIRNDPVTCARYFNHRFRELKKTWTNCDEGPFGKHKIIHMFHRIEFQHRGSPHVHMVIWLDNAPKYDAKIPQSEEEVINFIDSMITTSSDDPDIAAQIGKQFHKCCHTCFRDEKRQKCRHNAPFRPMDRTRILKPLEKDEEKNLGPDVAKKIREFNVQLDNELNHNSGNIASFDDLLKKMGVNLDFYILATRATTKHIKVFLKRAPKDCRINGYNKKILKLMRSNMDIQFVLDAYACIGYIVDYINKSARGLSRLLRMCVEECRKGNKTIKEQLKKLSHILYDCSEVSAQEAAWCRCRLAMCSMSETVEFINSGPPETRQRVLKRDIEIKKLPPGSMDIYMKGVIDRYAQRADEHEGLCLAEFAAKFTFVNAKGNIEKIEDENDVEDGLAEDRGEVEEIEDPSDVIPKKLRSYPLKDGSGFMRERRKEKVLRYCRFSFFKDPMNYFREMSFLFWPWRNEQTDISEKNWEELYITNEEIIKKNYCKYNACDIDFDAIARLIEEDRAAEDQGNDDQQIAKNDDQPLYLNAYDYDVNVIQPDAAMEMGLDETAVGVPTKYGIPEILDSKKFFELMDSSNVGQRDFLMHLNYMIFYGKGPFYYFLTGGAGTGKSHAIRASYQSLMRQFRASPSENPELPEILIVSFTGIAAFNVDGITAHSAFNLIAGNWDHYIPLTPDQKNTMRANLRNLKLLIIDEISMMSSKLLYHISCRLNETFATPLGVYFGGISVIVVGDFNQLPPVGGRYAFQSKDAPHKKNSTAAITGNPMWDLFKKFKLEEIMRQKDDKVFAEALNRLAIVQCTPEDILMWESRVFKEENLPPESKNAISLFEYRMDLEPYNDKAIAEKRPGAKFDIISKAVDRLVGNPTFTQRNQAKNALAKMTTKETQGLMTELALVENVRYMIMVNIKVSDGLCNGALGTLRRIDFEAVPGQDKKRSNAVWIELDSKNCGIDARREKVRFMEANNIPDTWTPIYRCNKQFNVLARGQVQVNRYQYPIVPAEALSLHKSQGLTQHNGVKLNAMGRILTRQKMYTGLSRAPSLDKVFIINEFKLPHPPGPKDPVICEMQRMDEECQLEPHFIKLRTRSENEFCQIISHNVQSLNAHIKSIINDETYVKSDLMMFQETWLKNNEDITIESFQEVCRNKLDNARGKGTIIFRKSSLSFQICDAPSYEIIDGSGHCEITSVLLDNSLLVINVYKNPNCTHATFIKAMDRYANIISQSANVLIMGDFNEDLKTGSGLNKLMQDKYDLQLLSPQEFTTTNRKTIDGVFGKLIDFNVVCDIYFSYFSVHFPIVIKIFKNNN